jgi:hypothetical protein
MCVHFSCENKTWSIPGNTNVFIKWASLNFRPASTITPPSRQSPM